MRARAPQHPSGANPYLGATVRNVKGGGWLVLLTVLLWLSIYQNLPDNLGGMSAGGGVAEANVQNRIIKISLIVMSIYLIASRWSLVRSLAKHVNLGAAAVLVLAPLSALWSIEPAATLLRFTSLASIALVCFAISLAGWHRYRLQQVGLPPLMLILLASLVVGIIYPDKITELGTDLSQNGAWHGVTHSKNEFGMMSSISVIICANRWLSGEGSPFGAIAGTAVAFVCLTLSRSNTSLFATLVALFFMVLVMRVPVIRQRYSTHVAAAIAGTILLYELAIQDVVPGVYTLLTPIRNLTGKDTTLSGRTIIWKVIKDHIPGAPYLGTGYGAYWLGPTPSSPSYVFVPLMYFYPTEAHNGYLDIVNDLGLVGLACLLAFLFFFIRQALELMRTDRSQAALYLALLFQQMVMNMSESEWFSRGSTFAILLLATACMCRAAHEARLHTQSV
jgi:O-antigen ligase